MVGLLTHERPNDTLNAGDIWLMILMSWTHPPSL